MGLLEEVVSSVLGRGQYVVLDHLVNMVDWGLEVSQVPLGYQSQNEHASRKGLGLNVQLAKSRS